METKLNDQKIEQEIQEKGLTAPRLTPGDIQNVIVGEQYYVFPGTTLTVCCLTLKNGACVTGESACVSPANFNAELGQKIAKDNAVREIWALEGYLLREKLAKEESPSCPHAAPFKFCSDCVEDQCPIGLGKK